MKRIALTTAIALGLAAPAFANDQLARSLGVEPGVYTTAQLVELKDAVEATGNDARVFFADSFAFTADATAGADQLAANLGVEPGRYSVAELAILKDASTRVGNDARIHFDAQASFVSDANAGAEQLAASLGVPAGQYTPAQLALLKDASTQVGNDARIHFE